MLTEYLPKPTGPRRFYMLFGALIIAAWGLLIAWQNSPYAELLGHESLADHHIPFASHLGGFLLSWLLMTVAMILPANLPLLAQTQRNRMGMNWSAAQMVVGYHLPWIGFGLLAFLGDSILHELAEEGAPLAGASGFIAPAILLTVGIYQLTPIKRKFIERCKPTGELGLPPDAPHQVSAIKHGFRMGLNCVGSCCSIMLLMFALGQHRLEWMVVLGGIASAERFLPWGSRLAQWVGAGIIAWGIYSVIVII